MFKLILAVGLWVAIVSFALTVIMYIYSMIVPQFNNINNLYYLSSITSWSFYLSIVAAAAVVIFSKKSEKQD
jgi:uncharacterized membrane protein YphA (DoxX/SURF4 family)